MDNLFASLHGSGKSIRSPGVTLLWIHETQDASSRSLAAEMRLSVRICRAKRYQTLTNRLHCSMAGDTLLTLTGESEERVGRFNPGGAVKSIRS